MEVLTRTYGCEYNNCGRPATTEYMRIDEDDVYNTFRCEKHPETDDLYFACRLDVVEPSESDPLQHLIDVFETFKASAEEARRERF